MAVTSVRDINIRFFNDFVASNVFSAAQNTNSPGQADVRTLAIGANTITPPAGGSVATGVTIIPPAGNVLDITLKGVTGDIGIVLHHTDPTSIGLDSPTSTFVLTAEAEIVGVRLIWT